MQTSSFGPVGTLPQAVRRDFSTVGYDEAMRRAREIVSALRERAQATEDARMLIRENEQLLHETGLFRFHQPKIFGGMELDFVAIFDIPAEIARGCPSTAWNVGNLATHHWMLGFYEPETQHEVWDANPDALIASSIALAAGRGRKVDGGFEVTGRWPFSSGVDNSDWNMLAVTVYDGDKAVDWRLCLVPKTDYEIIDTWYAMGMSGTGSKDIAVKELFVPERRALELAQHPRRLRASGRRAPSWRAVRYPDHRRSRHPALARLDRRRGGRLRAFRRSDAQSACGTYTGAKVADFQAVQIKLARARVLIDSGRALSRNASIALQEMSARGEIPDIATKLRWRAQSALAVNQAREAVETLWSCYGAQGLYTRDPLQRHLRDVIAMNQHFSFNFDIAGAAFGLHALGGNYVNPAM